MLLGLIANRPKQSAERKRDRGRRTEQQLLNAALRVFARDGISRLRIAGIAAEAGISASTLYEHYNSNKGLAYEVPFSHLVSFFGAYRKAVVGKTTAREGLMPYLSIPADFAREHAEWARLLYLELWPSIFVSETELRHNSNDYPPPPSRPAMSSPDNACGDQGGRSLPYRDHASQRDVADRLHLLQDHRLGLDVSVDRARRCGSRMSPTRWTWRLPHQVATRPMCITNPGC